MFELEKEHIAAACCRGCAAVARSGEVIGVVGRRLRLIGSDGHFVALRTAFTGVGDGIAGAGECAGEIELSVIGFARDRT